MKKLMYTMLMLVLACSMSALAQTDMSSGSKSDQMSGKEKTITGCVAEKDGKYWLVDSKHPDGVQLTTSEDLKPHVGHKMSFTGSMGKMDSSMSSDTSKSDDKMASHDSMGGAMDLKVTSMKMISEKCEMPPK